MQVVAVGGGKSEDGKPAVAPNVSVGQTVMYSKYSGTEFEVGSRVLGIYLHLLV
jgi:co-chaperonin GroES (HSP10)